MPCMSPDTLKYFGVTLYGNGWQTALAKKLEVDPKTIHAWAEGRTKIPKHIALAVGVLSESEESVLSRDFPRESTITPPQLTKPD